MKTFEQHSARPAGRTVAEILKDAQARGFTHYFWATDEGYGFNAFYNGDTVVVYTSTADMTEAMQADAHRYGREI